jgi:hypothetical protein
MVSPKNSKRCFLPYILLMSSICLFSEPGDKVPYPHQYRKWWHVKTTVIGPQSPNFTRNGGFHEFYANEIAMEGYRTGKFPDGSCLVDVRLEAKDVDGVTTEGPRMRVAVMMKQAARHQETGGWGFEVFKGDQETEGSLTPQEKTACFACHRKGRDSVFGEFR